VWGEGVGMGEGGGREGGWEGREREQFSPVPSPPCALPVS